jgi:hypothetical protein
MTAARIVLAGAILLVVLGGVYVADRNRNQSHIRSQERYVSNPGPGPTCLDTKTQNYVAVHLCNNEDVLGAIDSWRQRKGWYEYAAGALVVLTLAGAFAASRRGQPRRLGN